MKATGSWRIVVLPILLIVIGSIGYLWNGRETDPDPDTANANLQESDGTSVRTTSTEQHGDGISVRTTSNPPRRKIERARMQFLEDEKIRVYLEKGHYSDTPILEILFFSRDPAGREKPKLIRGFHIERDPPDNKIFDLDCNLNIMLDKKGARGIRLGIADLADELDAVYTMLRKGGRYKLQLQDLENQWSKHEIVVPSNPERGQVYRIKLFTDAPQESASRRLTISAKIGLKDRSLSAKYFDPGVKSWIGEPVRNGALMIKTAIALGGELNVYREGIPRRAIYVVNSVAKSELSFPEDADWTCSKEQIEKLSFSVPPNAPQKIRALLLRLNPYDHFSVFWMPAPKDLSKPVVIDFIPGDYALLCETYDGQKGDLVRLGTVNLRNETE